MITEGCHPLAEAIGFEDMDGCAPPEEPGECVIFGANVQGHHQSFRGFLFRCEVEKVGFMNPASNVRVKARADD